MWFERLTYTRILHNDYEFDLNGLRSGKKARLITIQKSEFDLLLEIDPIPYIVFAAYADGIISSANRLGLTMKPGDTGYIFISFGGHGEIVCESVLQP